MLCGFSNETFLDQNNFGSRDHTENVYMGIVKEEKIAAQNKNRLNSWSEIGLNSTPPLPAFKWKEKQFFWQYNTESTPF